MKSALVEAPSEKTRMKRILLCSSPVQQHLMDLPKNIYPKMGSRLMSIFNTLC